MNRFSFICIIIGYGINLFGNITDGSSKLYILLVISLFCIAFTYTGQKLSSLISKKTYKEDKKVDQEIIEEVLDVQWSNKEQEEFIDKLFKGK